eukprot:5374302-Amphidinium_carterae.2
MHKHDPCCRGITQQFLSVQIVVHTVSFGEQLEIRSFGWCSIPDLIVIETLTKSVVALCIRSGSTEAVPIL